MTDLDDLFTPLIDESATRRAPVELVETRAREHRRRERRRHRVQGFVAGALAIALVVGLISFARSDHNDSAPPAASTSTTVATPTGWTAHDYGLARLSIPPLWTVGAGCPEPDELTMNEPGNDAGSCGAYPGGPSISISPYTPPRDHVHQPFAPSGEVNGFPYEYVIPKCIPQTCPDDWYSFEKLGVTIAFRGDIDRRAVLRTLAYSTYAKLTQHPFGRVPSTWKTESYDGFALRVPSSWTVHGSKDNVPCTPPQSSAWLGTASAMTSCFPRPFTPPKADWAWLQAIRPDHETARVFSGTPSAHNGLSFVAETITSPFVYDVTYLVTDGSRSVTINLGFGANPAIARGILGSLRVANG